MLDLTTCNLLRQLNDFAGLHSIKIWIVGGYIRDQLLSLESDDTDIDLVFDTDVNNLVSKLAAFIGCSYKSFEDFKTAKLTGLKGKLSVLDIATMRSEIYLSAGELPSVSLGSFEQDYLRRDFSINALYCNLNDFISNNFLIDAKFILDKGEGLNDIRNRLIRVLHNHSFTEDPSRLFRAVRYKVRCNARLHQDTKDLFNQALGLGVLNTISRQRILNELRKACYSADRRQILAAFVDTELMLHSDLLTAGNGSSFLKLIQQSDTIENAEFFELLCAALYFLDRNDSKFQSFGFGRKFFRIAKDKFKFFESKIN